VNKTKCEKRKGRRMLCGTSRMNVDPNLNLWCLNEIYFSSTI